MCMLLHRVTYLAYVHCWQSDLFFSLLHAFWLRSCCRFRIVCHPRTARGEGEGSAKMPLNFEAIDVCFNSWETKRSHVIWWKLNLIGYPIPLLFYITPWNKSSSMGWMLLWSSMKDNDRVFTLILFSTKFTKMCIFGHPRLVFSHQGWKSECDMVKNWKIIIFAIMRA